jgi:hypothetical protein
LNFRKLVEKNLVYCPCQVKRDPISRKLVEENLVYCPCHIKRDPISNLVGTVMGGNI